MESTANPEGCYFGECPYSEVDQDLELRSILEFCLAVIDVHNPKTQDGREEDPQFHILPEIWAFGCRIFGVPQDKEREAYSWASMVVQAARDAVKLRGRDEATLIRDDEDV